MSLHVCADRVFICLGRYEFKCMAPADGQLSACGTRYTNADETGAGDEEQRGKIEFLDRHNIGCNGDEVVPALSCSPRFCPFASSLFDAAMVSAVAH